MTDLDVYEILVLRHKYQLNVAEIATIFQESMSDVREALEEVDNFKLYLRAKEQQVNEPWRGIADG